MSPRLLLYQAFVWTLVGVILEINECAPGPPVTPFPRACDIINDTFVDCRHCSFKTVPSDIPVTVETLLLSYNTIHTITNESFHGLVNLVTLELHHNSISKLKGDFFKDQGKLRQLILHHNQIGKLPDDVFHHMPNLEFLDLSYMSNGLMRLPGALFGLAKLRVLNVSANRLQYAKFETGIRLPALRELRLAKNKITSLQNGDFEALENITLSLLDLTNNQISDVDVDVFRPLRSVNRIDFSQGLMPGAIPALANALSNVLVKTLYLKQIGLTTWNSDNFRDLRNSSVEMLDISYNNLTALNSTFPGLLNITHFVIMKNQIASITESAFSGLGKVETLDLSDNHLAMIRDGMFASLSTVPLRTLYLNSNKIKSIDVANAFRGLPNLKYLKLSKNKISQNFKGEEFNGLDSLEVLDLGSNKNVSLSPDAFRRVQRLQTLYLNLVNMKNITVRPSPFTSLRTLQKLDLSNNNMAFVDVDTFSSLGKVETLYLQHNNFYNMWNLTTRVHFLKPVHNLRYVDLCYNGFQNIPNDTFYDLPQLETIKLCHNKISHLEDELFEGLHLRSLDLSYNMINLINHTLLEPVLPTLDTLKVSVNPFSCSCELRWFRNWIENTNTHIDDLKRCICSSPPSMQGKHLISFHPETLNCDHELPLYAWILIGVGAASMVTIAGLIVKFRWYITYYYHLINAKRKKYVRLEGGDRQFKYDAFVSFCHEDQDWIENDLIPHMEKEDDFRLCIHDRDFRLGSKILDSIVQAVDDSRYTLCLLSNSYLKSRWCKMEREFAMANLIHRDVLIIIRLEDIPQEKLTKYYKLHKVMMKRTYLDWPQEEGKRRDDFWIKLKTVLREPDLRINNNESI